MKKDLLITIGIVMVVLGLILAVVYFTGGVDDIEYPTTDSNTKSMILFYGDGCTFCKIVDDFIVTNDIAKKVDFIQSEVWHNKSNAQLLAQKAVICGIETNTIGIPFLFDGKDKCYSGDVDIINFFKNATGI